MYVFNGINVLTYLSLYLLGYQRKIIILDTEIKPTKY